MSRYIDVIIPFLKKISENLNDLKNGEETNFCNFYNHDYDDISEHKTEISLSDEESLTFIIYKRHISHEIVIEIKDIYEIDLIHNPSAIIHSCILIPKEGYSDKSYELCRSYLLKNALGIRDEDIMGIDSDIVNVIEKTINDFKECENILAKYKNSKDDIAISSMKYIINENREEFKNE